MQSLKRVHLANVAMTYDQAIAIIEILPDVKGLAHIQLLSNDELVKLADAKSAAAQEEACALYASLLTATKLSKTLVCVDVEVPSESSSELVKAMAKQVVAYCLRNMERFPVADIGNAVAAALSDGGPPTPLPNVLTHLVDHEKKTQQPGDHEPDEHYVMGGTGVVKALTCCLDNKGEEESRRPSTEMQRPDSEMAGPAHMAKDMSKQLLTSARQIRESIRPSVSRLKADPETDEEILRKIAYLDTTLRGIIQRFEDEYPETRGEPTTTTPNTDNDENLDNTSVYSTSPPRDDLSPPPAQPVPDPNLSEGLRPSSARSQSALSETARAHVREEARVHRAGHRFRASIVRPEHVDLLSESMDDVSRNPTHVRLLHEMLEDLGPEVAALVGRKGVVRTITEDRPVVLERIREADPVNWRLFIESQEKARANLGVRGGDGGGDGKGVGGGGGEEGGVEE